MLLYIRPGGYCSVALYDRGCYTVNALPVAAACLKDVYVDEHMTDVTRYTRASLSLLLKTSLDTEIFLDVWGFSIAKWEVIIVIVRGLLLGTKFSSIICFTLKAAIE